ncbi:MAG: type II toxin-antitoxin system HicB family antitoxin [Ignavibacteria bacterium]|jgi:predicted RNase H-like HicB family nuclease|nr:type II toxin-antitoxin system HicB family antitoxin [Ignavibacteria bacterium]
MTIQAIVHEEDGGYWAEFPELEGCVTEADTLEELDYYMKEVVMCHLMLKSMDGIIVIPTFDFDVAPIMEYA